MNCNRLTFWLGLALAVCHPTIGRGQTPDLQGRAPLSLVKAILVLQDGNADARAYAAYSLAQLGPMAFDGIPALLEVLKKDTDADVRGTAAYALGRVGTSSKVVLPALREAMKDRDAGVRISAAGALGLLSQAEETEAVAFLLRCLAESKPGSDDRTPQLVFEALRQLGQRARGCGRLLVRWLADPRLSVRIAVLAALDEIDDDAHDIVPGLIAVLADDRRSESLGLLVGVGRTLLKPALTGRLSDEASAIDNSLGELAQISRGTREVRRMAIEMLGRYGPKAADAVPQLTMCLADRRLCKDAERALERIQGRTMR